jgi:RHS repeat-associated protein
MQIGTENGYKYNGKELNDDFGLNWYDYGARWYMADIGRWGQIDPLAGSMAAWSPYSYTFNNPLKYTDPTGMAPFGDFYYAFNGQIRYLGNDGNVNDGKQYLVNDLSAFGNAKKAGGSTQRATNFKS